MSVCLTSLMGFLSNKWVMVQKSTLSQTACPIIIGFGLFIGFTDNVINIEYYQTYPLNVLPAKFSHQAGLTPTIVRTFRAILRCRPHSSIDDAMTRPLRKRKLVSRKYWGQTFLDGRTPSVGKRQTGSIAVTARGRASVHQNTAISTTT